MLHATERHYRQLLANLEPKEQHFVSEYLIHKNAARAARKAGYSVRCAKEAGYELLTKAHIEEAVQAGLAMIAHRCEVNAERVTRELAAVGFSSVANYEFDEEGQVQLVEDAPSEAILAVANIRRRKKVTTLENGAMLTTYETEYRLYDKLKALELLGKKLRLWTDRVEVEGAQDQVYRILLQQLKEGRSN
jgi:phage terminase small subunit